MKAKYSNGDTLYTIYENGIYEFEVRVLEVLVNEETNRKQIRYSDGIESFLEDKCFCTKEELLKSL